MMDTTTRFEIPLLSPLQLQKESWINEGLLRLDMVVNGQLSSEERDAPPDPSSENIWYRVGVGASGPWAGQAGKLAALTPAGWRFLDPPNGIRMRDIQSGVDWTFADGSWSCGMIDATVLRVNGNQVVGGRQPPISDPVGGPTSDEEGRAAIRAILTTLRGHGLIG